MVRQLHNIQKILLLLTVLYQALFCFVHSHYLCISKTVSSGYFHTSGTAFIIFLFTSHTFSTHFLDYMSCNSKTASLSCELCELVSLQTLRESSAIDRVHGTQVEYRSGSWSEIIEHCPLVMWQSLSQSEAFLPLSLEWSQPIRDFPTIEPGMLQRHLFETI